MTNLNSPAADAASGLSNTPNAMPDVIDALKRLERVGSENSKTTQKLLTAATELSSKIVEQFDVSTSETITASRKQFRRGDDEFPWHEWVYLIENGRLKNGRMNRFVDECRDS